MPFPFKVISNVTLQTRVSELNLQTTERVHVPLDLIPGELENVSMSQAFYLDAPVSYLTSGANIGNASPDATLGQLGTEQGFYRIDPKKLGR